MRSVNCPQIITQYGSIYYTNCDNIANDMFHIKYIHRRMKIQTGWVLSNIVCCDKWDVDALADNFDNIDLDTLTIDGHALSETEHPQLADDPIFSPYLRTVEYRADCLKKALPNLNYVKLESIALSLGITSIQNGKRLKKSDLYNTIQATPM
jgi:hypothetical protein